MKFFRLVLVISLLAPAMSGAHQKRYKENPGNLATIYIYRTRSYIGSLANLRITLNQKKVCELSNNRYLVLRTDLAENIIQAGNQPTASNNLIINALAGHTYYIRCKPSFRYAKLELIDSTSAVQSLKKVAVGDRCME